MVAHQTGFLWVWVRMRRRDGLSVERSCAGQRFAINYRELIFDFIIEGVLQTPLDVAATPRLVLDIPAGRAPKRLVRPQRIAVPHRLFDLLERSISL
jgi:hypothetical protein